MARTLIICPTHDHVDTLFASVASVQAQSDHDWELVVICDGAPDRSAEILTCIGATDPRVSHRVFPKGERFGEVYRDEVIRGSRAEFICHLGDDDIWGDGHVAAMTGMLEQADFALQGTLELGAGGTWTWGFANSGTAEARALAQLDDRTMMIAGLNNFAVRRDAYLRLERGWSAAPKHYGSDVYMCTEYLRNEGMRIASSAETTFAKLPSRLNRSTFTPERRLVELTPVLARINAPGYLQRARGVAVIGVPIIRALQLCGAQDAATLPDAMAMIGLELVAEDTQASVALNGELMMVPATQSHRNQCEMAWRLLRAATCDDGTDRLREITKEGLSFLLTPYLETLDENDRAISLDLADIVEGPMAEPEIAAAFRLRTRILMDDLDIAEGLIADASQHWPDAGWLGVMRQWYADRRR